VSGTLTRINNNQITDAIGGNTYVGINANTKIQPYSITSALLANNLKYASDLTITGNLSITGNVTAIDTTHTTIEDPLLILASNQTGSPTLDIGYIGIRGSSSNIALVWQESSQKFVTAYTSSDRNDTTTITLTSYADFATGNLSASGDIVSANVSLSGNVLGNLNVSSYVNAGNVTTPGDVSVTGNVYTGNVIDAAIGSGQIVFGDTTTAGLLTATSTLTTDGNNVSVGGNVSAGGNITAANFTTSGASGNISGANVISATTITATGNIGAGSFLFGDGYYISNINPGNVSSTKIFNGNSYANIASSDGNLVVAVGATSNVVATFYDQGVNFANNISVLGNVQSGENVSANNVSTTNNVSAGGNVYAANISTSGNITAANITDSALSYTQVVFAGTSGLLSGNNNFTTDGTNVTATGNVSGGNIYTGGQVSATGDATAGNVLTAGFVTATGNVTGGNILTGGQVSATGDATAGNIKTAGFVTATGNVHGGNIITAGLVTATGDVLTSGNVSATGNVHGGNITTIGVVTATANVTGGNITTIGVVTATGNVTGGNLTTVGIATITGNVHGGNILSAGLISAAGDIQTFGNANITGDTNAANVYATNISTTGNIIAGPTGNVSGANVVTPNVVTAGQLTFVSGSAGILFSTSGNVDLGNVFLTNLAGPPVNNQDAVNKAYVDGIANGLQVKASSNAATTGNILSTTGQSYTYNNGTSGVGATITFGAVGVITIDGITLTSGMRVLIKNEPLVSPIPAGTTPSAAYNGIYTVTTAGSPGAALVLTRATDDDVALEMYSAYTFIQAGGTTNGLSGWASTNTPTNPGPITIGTTFYNFSQFSQAGSYSAGNGLSLTGTQFNALTDGLTTYIDVNNQIAVLGNLTLTTPDIANASFSSLSATGGTGNIFSNSILSNGTISSTGDVQTGGNFSATGTVIVAEIFTTSIGNTSIPYGLANGALGTDANLTYNSAPGLLTTYSLSASGTISTGTTVIDTGGVSTTGTVTAASVVGGVITGSSLSVTGDVTAAGNVVGNYVNSTYDVSAGGNVYAANISTNGNVTAANVISATTITATGNVGAGSYLFGDGYYISNINPGNVSSTKIFNGNSYANIASSNGNLVIAIGAGSATVATFYDQGVNFSNDVSVTGNILLSGNISASGDVYSANTFSTGNIVPTTDGLYALGNATNAWKSLYVSGDTIFLGNIQLKQGAGNVLSVVAADGSTPAGVVVSTVSASGNISSTGTVFAGNISTAGFVTATGNVTSGNVLTAGFVTATGNVTSGNVLTGGLVSATGNATAGNVLTGGLVSATGNATAGNVLTGGLVSATGNATAGNLKTAGSVTATGNVYGGNVITGGFVSATGDVLTSGNVSAAGNIASGTTFFVDTSVNSASFGNATQVTGAVVAFNASNSIVLPVGNTVQRPNTPTTGMIRYNSTLSQCEVWNGSAWVAVGGSAYTIIQNEQFNGDGSTTQFFLGSSQTTDSCIVTINGVVQIPTTAYSVSGVYPTCVLTFTEAPMTGDTIDVREITTTTTVTAISNSPGNAIVSVSQTTGEVDITGNLVAQLNATAPTLNDNSTMSFQLVSNTSLKILVRGSDGTTRSATLTLS